MHLAAIMLGSMRNLIPLATESAAPTAPLTHDRPLVALAMALAVAGAYAALELGARSRARTGASGYLWLAASGFALGAGVWAMHFVGLIALETSLMRGFAPGPTIVSAAIAIAFAVSGYVLGGPRFHLIRYLLAGVWAGLGGVFMHYAGMSGLVIDAELSYQPLYVVGTSLGAILSATASLWLCASAARPVWMQLAFACFMGSVIAGLHFFDMAGAVLTPRPQFSSARDDMLPLAFATTLAILALAALAAFVARWDERRNVDELDPSPLLRGLSRQPSRPPGERQEGIVIVPDVRRQARSDAEAPPR